MKYKKSFIFICLIVCLFSIASISAGDVNDTAIASEDTNQIDLSQNNEITEDNLQTSEENSILTQIDNNESLSVETNSEILADDIGNYSGLADEINQGGNIELAHKYYEYDSGSTIEITGDNRIIDGKGAVIDMAGSTNMRAFYVSASGVIIKDLIIKNAKYDDGDGGAIYFTATGTVTNCNFINNTASNYGGAVFFSGHGTVTDCNFTDNNASRGGAVYFNSYGQGTVSNCDFVNNTASNYGGSVCFYGQGSVTDCNFTDNTASHGGAVFFIGQGSVSNCSFVNNTASDSGGAVYLNSKNNVSNCNFTDNKAGFGGAVRLYSGSVSNCDFVNNTASDSGGAVYFRSKEFVYVTNCDFVKNTATNFGGAVRMSDGSVSNCDFVNNTATYYGGAVYFDSYAYGTVTDCNFTDNTASSRGGAVYFNSYSQGTVSNCDFVNNTASNYGGAVCFYGQGTVENCNFIDNTASRGDGGAVYFDRNGEGTVIDCNFTDNTAAYGGAVYFISPGTVTDCNFTDNTASNYGGAVWMAFGTVENCNFTDNTASSRGGAVYFDSIAYYGEGNVTNCNFVKNTAIDGGAILMSSGNVSNCDFTDNTASRGDGGAVCFYNPGNVTNCNFVNNTASNIGGAVRLFSGSVTNCDFTDCGTDRDRTTSKSAIYDIAHVIVENCTFKDTITIKTIIEVSQLTTVYNANTYLVASLKDSQGKGLGGYIVSIDFNGIANYTTDGNGQVKLSTKGLTPNTYDVAVSFAGEGVYNESSNATNVVINKDSTKLNANEITTTVSVIKNLLVTLKDSQGKALSGFMVSIDFNGIANYMTNGNGQVKLSTKGLTPNTYIVNITFAGNENYTQSNITTQVTINKELTQITASNITTVYDANKDLIITLKNSKNNALKGVIVSVNLNGVKNYTTDENGTVKVSTKGLAPNTYTVVISFAGNENYSASNATTAVTVNKDATSLTSAAVSTNYNVAKNLVVTLKGSNGVIANKKVTVKVGTISKTLTTNSKGQVSVDISTLVPKAYTASVKFAGDNNYKASSNSVKVTVKKDNTKLVASSKAFKVKATKKVTATLKDSKGRIIKNRYVTFKVAGKSYKVKTNSKGVATATVKITKKGSFATAVSFAGDAYYNKCSKAIKITVK